MGNLKNKQKYALHPSTNLEDAPKHDDEDLEFIACKERKQKYSCAW